MSMMKAQPAKAMSKDSARPKAKGATGAKDKMMSVGTMVAKDKMVSISSIMAKDAMTSKGKGAAMAKGQRMDKPKAKRRSGQEAMLARVEAVRMMQREEGSFDCFGRAGGGYCDQGGCSYHAECLSVSRMIHAM